ncbi:MAG: sensor histidine kinase [Bacteroidales bacterium]|nr:sensor histidine kinase [Bacteroidales bacterium]
MKNPKFDINPHVIRQLGAELVTDQTTALMELVKNSYDADADYVKITINTKEVLDDPNLFYPNKKGYIIVEDNGFGMDEDTIINSWLVISFSNKRAVDGVKPKTPKGRTPLGDKGLGRLSTQRLAQVCEIYTKKEESTALHVGFDWDTFDTANKLQDVIVNYNVANMSLSHGTKLILTGLNDDDYWRGKKLEAFKSLICKLISPYKELRPFNVYLTIDGEDIDVIKEVRKLNQLSISEVVFQYKNGLVKFDLGIRMRKLAGNDFDLYERIILPDNGKRFLEFFFNDKKRSSAFKMSDGQFWLTVHQEFRLEELVSISLLDNDTIADPGDFFGQIQEFYFTKNNKNSEWWTQLYSNFDEYKTFVQYQVGVRIYRNGFSVKPYGIEDGDDWLNLGKGQTSNSSFYGFRPHNVIGYVAIDEAINKYLKDKTDREGFIDNEYYRNFYALVSEVIRRSNQEMENLRRSYNEFRPSLSSENTKIKSIKDAFNTIAEQAEKGKRIASSYAQTQAKLDSAQKQVKKALENSKTDLFEQSTDSATIQALQDISKLLEESKQVLEEANVVLNDSKYLEEACGLIQPKLELLEEQLADFSELASLGLVSEMVSHDLGGIVDHMLGKSTELEQKLKKSEEIDVNEIYSVIDFIKMTVASLKSQMKHLDSSMKYTREKKETFKIGEMLKEEEIAYYQNKPNCSHIDFRCIVENDFAVTMNKGKFIQVMDNLINNSIYWLNVYQNKISDKPTISIRVDKPWIYVEDNGLGVDPTIEESLFEPFATRKPKGDGRGLGLFIIRQLLDNVGCEVFLDPIRNEYKRRYRFSINLLNVITK